MWLNIFSSYKTHLLFYQLVAITWLIKKKLWHFFLIYKANFAVKKYFPVTKNMGSDGVKTKKEHHPLVALVGNIIWNCCKTLASNL